MKKKLFIVFYKEDFENIKNKIKEDEVIIFKERLNIKSDFKNIFFASEHIVSEKKLIHYSYLIRKVFIKKKLDIKYINNYFSNIAIPFLKVYDLAKKIIKEYNIEEVILIGGNKKILFIPYYFAEGETQIKVLYKSNWFYNGLLNFLLNKKIKISFYKEESFFKIKFSIFVRRYVLLFLKFFIINYKLIKWKRNINNFDYKIAKNKNIIFPVRSIAQVNSVLNLYHELKKYGYNPIFFSYELLFYKKNETAIYLLDNKLNFIFIYNMNIFKLLKITSKEFLNNIFQILKDSNILKEHLFMEFEKKIYKQLLNNSIRKLNLNDENSFLISSEMQSPEMFIEKSIFVNNYCNIQAQSMSENPLPYICYKKNFFVENLLTYNYLKDLPFSKCVKFIGTFKYPNIDLYKNKSLYNLNDIIFFTQPHEINNQKFILEFLCNCCKDKDIYIKLHPRDFNDYSDLLNKYNNLFLEEEKNIDIVLDKYDIVVSRTTTLLLDAIIRKKLVFSLIISDFDKLDKHVYINENYLIIIKKKENLYKIKKEIYSFNKEQIENKFTNLINDFYGNINFVDKFKELF